MCDYTEDQTPILGCKGEFPPLILVGGSFRSIPFVENKVIEETNDSMTEAYFRSWRLEIPDEENDSTFFV